MENSKIEMTSTTTPQGKKIPVMIASMNNGEAVNNVDINDMSPHSEGVYMTVAEYNERQRRSREIENMNLWSVKMTIMSKNIELGGLKYQIIDNKKSDVPVVGEDGEPLRYPSKYSMNVTYFGGNENYYISKEFYESFDVGSSYLMKFHRGSVTSYGTSKYEMILDGFEYLP